MANPYLQDASNAITNQVNTNLQTQILPGINSGAMMAGGYGGSRQGVAQGLAINGANQAIANGLANLNLGAYNTDQQIAAQKAMQAAALSSQESIAKQQTDLQRTLGLGNLGLGYYNADTSRGLGYGQLALQGDQQNFNNQLSGANFNLNAMNALQQWNNLGLGWANQQQQTPIQNLTQLSNIGASIGGQGGTASTPYQGNPWLGALGGAQLGGNIFGKLFGG